LWVSEGRRRLAGTRVCQTYARGAALVLTRTGHHEGVFFFTGILSFVGILGSPPGHARGAPVEFERGHEIWRKRDVSRKWYQWHTFKPEKNINGTYPEEVEIVFLFFSCAGPVPAAFRHLAEGIPPGPASVAGVFRAREAGGAPGLAESGTVFSSTWRTGSAETGITGNT
jgi:hypothetical protein